MIHIQFQIAPTTPPPPPPQFNLIGTFIPEMLNAHLSGAQTGKLARHFSHGPPGLPMPPIDSNTHL